MSETTPRLEPCPHHRSTNFDWATQAAYSDGRQLCWDCNQMFAPEPPPRLVSPAAHAALVAENAALREALKRVTVCLDGTLNVVRLALKECSRHATAMETDSLKAILDARAALKGERDGESNTSK